MGENFRVFAVLPTLGADAQREERRFAKETRALLDASGRVEAVDISDLERVREAVVREDRRFR